MGRSKFSAILIKACPFTRAKQKLRKKFHSCSIMQIIWDFHFLTPRFCRRWGWLTPLMQSKAEFYSLFWKHIAQWYVTPNHVSRSGDHHFRLCSFVVTILLLFCNLLFQIHVKRIIQFLNKAVSSKYSLYTVFNGDSKSVCRLPIPAPVVPLQPPENQGKYHFDRFWLIALRQLLCIHFKSQEA